MFVEISRGFLKASLQKKKKERVPAKTYINKEWPPGEG